MQQQRLLRPQFLASVVMSLALAACTSVPLNRAPVEQRDAVKPKPAASATQAATAPEARPLPGAENAGKPGYYTVKPGDTLLRIALDNGQNWRDIAHWNGIDNPNVIEVGRVLRVQPPANDGVSVATSKPITTSRPESRPLDSKPTAPSTPSSAASVAAAAPTSESRDAGDDELQWIWPASGNVIAGFDDKRNNGLDIGGKAGDPVLAAADGRVAYAGSGLRGFGNLVIIKHNATYLTAYAHNQTLLVKEDQVVHKGQKIAEMGNTDADQVELHFEVRKLGKPVDPAKLLPAR